MTESICPACQQPTDSIDNDPLCSSCAEALPERTANAVRVRFLTSELADYKAGLAAAQTRVQELEGVARDLAEQRANTHALLCKAQWEHGYTSGRLEGLTLGARAVVAFFDRGYCPPPVTALRKQLEALERLDK